MTVEVRSSRCFTVCQGVRLHSREWMPAAISGAPVVMLLHGFPQTSRAWGAVGPLIAAAGFHVIAPDLRGAGDSARPAGGYDKLTLAHDLRSLLQERGLSQVRAVVGHDVGLMVAYAFASEFEDSLERLVLMDAPLPGTVAFDEFRSDPRLWHWPFQAVPDLPEVLVSGRERAYVQYFLDRAHRPDTFSEDDLADYAAQFARPGAARAAFELYRAFDADVERNRARIARGRLCVPTLGVAGAHSTSRSIVERTLQEVAIEPQYVEIASAAHWLPEEAPAELAAVLLRFIS